jgi:lysophospholipase L1-like esterase
VLDRALVLASLAPLALAACAEPDPSAPQPGAAGRVAVAFYGDSLTEAPGYAPFVSGRFAAIVRGLSGERGTEGSLRFVADLDEKLVAIEEVDAAVLMWGTNDVGALDYTESALVGSLTRAVGEAVRRGLRVVVSLPPDLLEGDALALRNGRLAAYRSALAARLGESFDGGDVRVVDLAPRFAGHPDPRSLYSDGVHWSEAGNALAGAAVATELQALLGDPQGAESRP